MAPSTAHCALYARVRVLESKLQALSNGGLPSSPLAKMIALMKDIVGSHEAEPRTPAEFSGVQEIGWRTIISHMRCIIKEATLVKTASQEQADKETTVKEQADKVKAASEEKAEKEKANKEKHLKEKADKEKYAKKQEPLKEAAAKEQADKVKSAKEQAASNEAAVKEQAAKVKSAIKQAAEKEQADKEQTAKEQEVVGTPVVDIDSLMAALKDALAVDAMRYGFCLAVLVRQIVQDTGQTEFIAYYSGYGSREQHTDVKEAVKAHVNLICASAGFIGFRTFVAQRN